MRLLILLVGIWMVAPRGLWGQTFTRVTGGAVVTDGGRSTGSNWIDIDGDDDLDLFVANGNQNNQTNFLYRNEGAGVFTRITEGALVNDVGASIGGTWGDYDNDGDLDVFVSNREGQANFLYRNEGQGAFTRITEGAIATDLNNSNGASWIDVDNDGDLDLYVINFNEANALYQNQEDGTFISITSGVLVTEVSFSINGVWGDYDNDRDLDLFLANGGNQNNALFRNEADGTFTKITEGAIVNDGGNAIGASWGDYNNDGHLDLFVANFLGQNNFLYTNNGDGTFTRITEGSLVNDGGNSTGSAWGDLDNDGDLDLFVGDDGGFNFLYVNNGEGTFTKITEGDLVNDAANTFGVSVEDYDADGDLDVYAANRLDQNNVLYANDGNDHNWLRVRAVGTQSNASAIGARVSVKATLNGTEVWQMREVTSQSGYNSQSSLGVAFGLANAAVIDSLVIHWPSGMVDVFTDLAADQFLVATEGQTVSPVATEDETPLPEQVFLGPNYPNPFIPETHIRFVLPEARFVWVMVYDVLGREVTTLVEGRRTAGPHEATFDARGLPSGLYVYVLETDGVRRSRQMLLIK